MSTRRTIVASAGAAILALTVIAAVLRTDGADGSGIRGRVTGGCIVEGCHPTPKVGLQRVLRWTIAPKEGKPFPLVKKFRSAEDGIFRVSLPPGHYLIDQDPKSPAEGFMKAVEVTVREGQFAEVDLFYDVGMR